MSTDSDHSQNISYEIECRDALPGHLWNSLKISVGQPTTSTYNRTISTIPPTLRRHHLFIGPKGSSTTNFEIDFVGHALSDFIGNVPVISEWICDDSTSRRVTISNGITTPVSVVVPGSITISPRIQNR
jgi:hypothetical protein